MSTRILKETMIKVNVETGKMTENSAGGLSFKVSDKDRLLRLIFLGGENGTYYIGERKLAMENAQVVVRLLANGEGQWVVDTLIDISTSGRAAKQNNLLFVLAMCARIGDKDTRQKVYLNLDKFCRIPTHLFMFIGFVEAMPGGTGWGRGLRRAVCAWYTNKKPENLAMLVTKYKNREGWTHLDILRLSHVKPTTPSQNLLLKYIAKGELPNATVFEDTTKDDEYKTWLFLKAVEILKKTDKESSAIKLLTKFPGLLCREHIPTGLLNSCAVWEVLLSTMPLTAMLRNLGKMSSIELIVSGSPSTTLVCQKLTDVGTLKQARIHPFNVLVALKTYSQGHGEKGSLTWVPVPEIEAALSLAYDLSFVNVESTGKRYVLAMDISGSMGFCGINGSSIITPQEGAAAMAMCTLRKEPECTSVAFCTELVPYPMTPDMSLKQLTELAKEYSRRMGGTDCAQPMLWALKNNVKADVFVVYTDCETWAGRISPHQALQMYREQMGIPAKLIVCAMTSNGFTLADPNDSGMLDMPGFDSAAPEIMRNFVMGQIIVKQFV